MKQTILFYSITYGIFRLGLYITIKFIFRIVSKMSHTSKLEG